MLTIKNKIKRALPKVQPVIEDMLQISLGDIQVLPLPKLVDEVFRNLDAKSIPIKWKVLVYSLGHIILAAQEPFITATIGESTIYYSRNPLALLDLEKNIERTAAHELAHITHSRLVGFPTSDLKREFGKKMVEGFAEHSSREVISRIYGKRYENLVPRILRVYEREVSSFRQLLDKNKVKSDKDLVDFIKTASVRQL